MQGNTAHITELANQHLHASLNFYAMWVLLSLGLSENVTITCNVFSPYIASCTVIGASPFLWWYGSRSIFRLVLVFGFAHFP